MTVALLPGQMLTLLEIVTVGGGTTVMVMEPATGCVQFTVPPDVTLTSWKTVVVV